jgi:hypothetical protein
MLHEATSLDYFREGSQKSNKQKSVADDSHDNAGQGKSKRYLKSGLRS